MPMPLVIASMGDMIFTFSPSTMTSPLKPPVE